ncbi:MAG: AraC family transcriptional regulator [Lentisphaeria bacterium]|nr:AraC family transcriptional regulator [Lentisphaeria bacterium]
MKKKEHYYISVPVMNQAHFSMVAVFRESVEFVRNYTCPFNMIGICTRSEGENASVILNLKTGEKQSPVLNEISLCPFNLPQRYHHTLRNEHLSIHFKLELFPGVDVYSGQTQCFREISPKLTTEAKKIFKIADPILMISQCQEFALHFCHRHWPERYAFEVDHIRKFQDVLDYIHSSADASTEISTLAGILKMPLSSFTRAFHAVFSMPPKQFLQQELYRKAAQMLLAPDMSVKLAASALNFSSEFYFSHFFKRLSGISPKEYRNGSLFLSGRK